MPEGRRSKAKQNNAHWSGRQFWVGLVKVRYHVYDLFGRSKSGVLLAEVLIALKLWCFPVHRHFITINSYFRVEPFQKRLDRWAFEPLSQATLTGFSLLSWSGNETFEPVLSFQTSFDGDLEISVSKAKV